MIVFATSNPCFVGDFKRHRVTLVTAYCRTTPKKLVGIIHLVLKDDKGKPGYMTFLMLSMIQNHHTAYSAFISLANTLLEMMTQMNLMNKHGYNLHQYCPFSNRTIADISGIVNMETLICQNY